MSYSKSNASAATLTHTRVESSPGSGLCVTCLDGCPGYCEVGVSALRGREAIYPRPFGRITAGSSKDYPVDFSHFNIQGTCVGARGVRPDPDEAVFLRADVSTAVGHAPQIELRVPFFTGAMGSTDIARIHWRPIAVGAALSGSAVVIGENVCGMDAEAELKNGRIVRSPEMERRIAEFREWQDGAGAVLVQFNVEDGRLGVPEYVIEKLGVDAIELKWGQGAKNIGGEVKLGSLERALELKKRGYVVLPDPEDRVVQEAFRNGDFQEFERHSRLGMVEEEQFYRDVERLRRLGARHITLKTGSYRPADLARAVRCASDARIDLLTVDGSGGGTGMSPWRMMNEWGIPTVYLECLLYRFLERVRQKGGFIPPCAVAGGISLEDHIFKALALGSPYVKAVCLGRATVTAAMVGHHVGDAILQGRVPQSVKTYGDTAEQVFISVSQLRDKYGRDFADIPLGAIGVYTYYERLKAGLQQFMAGARKFSLQYLDRDDLMALTREASWLSGIAHVMESDQAEVDCLLG